MKKTIKSVMALALALVLTASCLGGTAFAEPSSSYTTTVGGHSAAAKVSKTTTSGTATTKISGVTSAYVTADVYLYLKFGRDYFYSLVSDEQTSTGYAIATAQNVLAGSWVIGAKGQHYIRFQDIFDLHTWKPSDTIDGTIPTGAKPA